MGNIILSNIEIVDTVRRTVFNAYINGKIDEEDLSEWEGFLCRIENRHRIKR